MTKKIYGYTSSGEPIDDEMMNQFAEEAEKGYDTDQLKEHRRGRGRPPLGAAAKVVGSLRLDPSLRRDAETRASKDGISVSELLRHALKKYLNDSKQNHGRLQELVDELSAYKQKLDGLDVGKHLSKIDGAQFLEAGKKITTLLGDYSNLLSQYAGKFQALSTEIKTRVDSEIELTRQAIKTKVENVQDSYTVQISRLKLKIEEAEKSLDHWDKLFNSKSVK